MLWHYIRVAARGLVRHKLYSYINIAGLARLAPGALESRAGLGL